MSPSSCTPTARRPSSARPWCALPADVAAAAGLARAWHRPDLRNHRKLVIVDGVVGFTGSQNMIADHYHKKKGIKRGLHWHELMVRLTGPTVRELDAVFVTDWYSETDELLPLDTSPVRPGADAELVDAQILPSGPASTMTTISSCSPHDQNARRRIASPAPTTYPTRPSRWQWSRPGPEDWTSSCSSPKSVISSWSSMPSGPIDNCSEPG